MVLEGLINGLNFRDLASLECQIVTHEAIKLDAIGLLSEGDFHWPPVVQVEPGLVSRLQTHQDEVANEVCLAQFATGGVHALEDELRVVLITAKCNVHNDKLGKSITQGCKV